MGRGLSGWGAMGIALLPRGCQMCASCWAEPCKGDVNPGRESCSPARSASSRRYRRRCLAERRASVLFRILNPTQPHRSPRAHRRHRHAPQPRLHRLRRRAHPPERPLLRPPRRRPRTLRPPPKQGSALPKRPALCRTPGLEPHQPHPSRFCRCSFRTGPATPYPLATKYSRRQRQASSPRVW